MAKEFAEYRPWKSWPQFDKGIGKYVGQKEIDRYTRYIFSEDALRVVAPQPITEPAD
jgi:hypothetical protein